eukprot:708027_1
MRKHSQNFGTYPTCYWKRTDGFSNVQQTPKIHRKLKIVTSSKTNNKISINQKKCLNKFPKQVDRKTSTTRSKCQKLKPTSNLSADNEYSSNSSGKKSRSSGSMRMFSNRPLEIRLNDRFLKKREERRVERHRTLDILRERLIVLERKAQSIYLKHQNENKPRNTRHDPDYKMKLLKHITQNFQDNCKSLSRSCSLPALVSTRTYSQWKNRNISETLKIGERRLEQRIERRKWASGIERVKQKIHKLESREKMDAFQSRLHELDVYLYKNRWQF